LIEFNQNPDKNQYFKELKLLTIRILSVYKDQLAKAKIKITRIFLSKEN
jgi:hypothetical protein